jgi:hypothetical protein
VTVLYRIVVDVINVTLIVTLVADGVFPKAPLPNASFSLLQTPGWKSLPSGNLCWKSRFDIMPSRWEIRVPGRQRPDAMQVIGQDNHGLDGKWSAPAGPLEPSPKIVNVFGQDFPAAFQQRHREEEGAARNKGANILRHKSGLTQLPKAGCVHFSAHTVIEGGMRFAFPPYDYYGNKYGPVSLQNICIKNRPR